MQPESDRKENFVGFRASRGLKERLAAAAAASDRSLSVETQVRIEQSFLVERLIGTGLLPVIRRFDETGIRLAEERGIPGSEWIRDREIFQLAALAAIKALLLLAPEPWIADEWKVILEQAYFSTHAIKSGQTGFIAPPAAPTKDEAA